jgi:hypothetical protein
MWKTTADSLNEAIFPGCLPFSFAAGLGQIPAF